VKQSAVRAALYLALTFFAGSAVGIFGYRLYTGQGASADVRPQRSSEYRRVYMAEMESRLNLDTEQRQRLGQILDQTESQFRQLNEKHRPEYRAIQAAQVEQITSILTPAQRTEYAKLRTEREERRKRDRH
jgi:hypothetical protein